MKVFSVDFNWKKKNAYQQCTSYASTVRESVRNAFSSSLETWISKFFLSLSTLGIPDGDSKLSKLQKNWIYGGKTAVDKRA